MSRTRTAAAAVRRALSALAVTAVLVAPMLHTDSDVVITHPAPRAPSTAPHWTGLDAHRYPTCTDVAASHGVVPDSLLIATRNGARSVVTWTDATDRRIAASWDDTDSANDLFTIGACTGTRHN
jgi:hypothetical protein